MKNYTALIWNRISGKSRTTDFLTVSFVGLRRRIEESYLGRDEVLMSLFPKDRVEAAF